MEYSTKSEIESIIYKIKEKSASDTAYLAALQLNPGEVFEREGVPVGKQNYEEFKSFLNTVAPQLLSEKNTLGLGMSCDTCKVAAWGVATMIVAVGVGGMALLTVESSCVIALWTFLGRGAITPLQTLAFIKTLVSVLSSGATLIALRVCEFAGCC